MKVPDYHFSSPTSNERVSKEEVLEYQVTAKYSVPSQNNETDVEPIIVNNTKWSAGQTTGFVFVTSIALWGLIYAGLTNATL